MLKKYLNAYTAIFFVGCFAVWFLWNDFKLPANAPQGVISPLALQHYNPANNILRFLLALLLPGLLCFGYWATLRWAQKKGGATKTLRRVLSVIIIASCIALAVGAAIVQASTNPANNSAEMYGGPYSYAMADTFHEGETLGPAVSYQDPKLKPYKDFVVVHGVFQDPLRTVIAFKIFGRSIGAARAFNVLLVIFAVILYFLLLVVLFRDLYKAAFGLVILAALMLPQGILPIINEWVYGVQFPFRDIATICFLLAATLGIRAAQNRHRKILVLNAIVIGFLATAGYANSIDRAMYISLLACLWLLIILVLLGKAQLRKLIGPVMVGFFAGLGTGMLVLVIALKGAVTDFLRYLLTMSSSKEYLDGTVFMQPDKRTGLLLLMLAGLLVLAGTLYIRAYDYPSRLKLKGGSRLRRLFDTLLTIIRSYPIEIILFCTAYFFMRNAIGRTDFAHFAYSVQWFYLLLIYLLLSHKKLSPFFKSLTFRYLTLSLLFIMVGWHMAAVKRIDIAHDTFPIHVKDTSLIRPDYAQTADYIRSHLNGDETFMTLTSEGIWYYLVDKPSPSRYYVIWYAFTSSQRDTIEADLRQKTNIKYVVTNSNWTSTFDFIPNEQRFPGAYKALHELYHPVKGVGQQTIWIRND